MSFSPEVSYAAPASGSSTTTDLGSIQIKRIRPISELGSTVSELGSTDLSHSASADGTSICTSRDIRVASALVALDLNDPSFSST